MSRQQLKARLYSIACKGIATANQANPFWSRREAFQALNKARRL